MEGVQRVGVPDEIGVEVGVEVVVAVVGLGGGALHVGFFEEVLRLAACSSPSVEVREASADAVVVAQLLLAFLAVPAVLVASGRALPLSVAVAPAAPSSVHGAMLLLVHAVGIDEEHGGVGLRKTAHAEVGIVVLGRLVLGCGVAVPAVEEAGLDGEVQHHVLAAVVLACALAELRRLVVGLDALHGLCRQLADDAVAAEEALAVHGDAYGFAVPRHRAVLGHLHAGQLADELVEARSLLQVEGFGVEDDGVAAHGEAPCTPLHLEHLHQRLGRLQLDIAHVQGVFPVFGEAQHGLRLGVVAQHRRFQHAAAAQVEAEAAQGVGRAVHDHRCRPAVVVDGLCQFQRSFGQRLLCLGIHDAPLEDVGT